MKVKASNYIGLTQEHVEKIKSRCVTDADTGCLVWQGAVTSKGYGNVVIKVGGHKRWLPPHRVMYVVLKDPALAPTMEIDHLCRNRLCCNPDCLEAVTSKENTRRGESFAAVNGVKTHCKYGHPFTEENTWRSPSTGRRKCRTCQKARRAKRYREIERNQEPPPETS